MVVISELSKSKEYSPEDLKHLHNILLSILKDFIDFCEKYDIEYFIDAGTILGSVRHNGFIPWDDDIDVILLRDQYEKFIKYSHNFDDKYDILCVENYEDYCRLSTKISLKNTRTGEILDNNTDFRFGINIDVFILDNMPNPGLKRTLYKAHVLSFKKILFWHEVCNSDIYLSKNKERIGHLIKFCFKILNINTKTLKKLGKKLINKSKEFNSDYYCNYYTIYPLDALDKNIFSSYKKSEFESLEVKIPIGYKDYLNILYGEDYMELPPVEKRTNHKYDGFDFGDY